MRRVAAAAGGLLLRGPGVLLRRRCGPPLLLLLLGLAVCLYLMVGDDPGRPDVCYKVPPLQMLTRRFVCSLEALQRDAQVSFPERLALL